jgi:uncharacterized protein (DUF1499 family)
MLIISGLVISLILIFFIQTSLVNTLLPKELGLVQDAFYELNKNMAGISSQTIHREKFVEPLPFKDNLEISKQCFIEAAKYSGNYKVVNEYKTYMYLVFTSSFFKWNDDVEVHFDDILNRIHIKSVARVNYTERKRNLRRYRMIKSNYLDR